MPVHRCTLPCLPFISTNKVPISQKSHTQSALKYSRLILFREMSALAQSSGVLCRQNELLNVTKAGCTYSYNSALRTANISEINSSKTESNVHDTYRFSSYLTENAMCLNHKDQSVNTVQENSSYLLYQSHGAHS